MRCKARFRVQGLGSTGVLGVVPGNLEQERLNHHPTRIRRGNLGK